MIPCERLEGLFGRVGHVDMISLFVPCSMAPSKRSYPGKELAGSLLVYSCSWFGKCMARNTRLAVAILVHGSRGCKSFRMVLLYGNICQYDSVPFLSRFVRRRTAAAISSRTFHCNSRGEVLQRVNLQRDLQCSAARRIQYRIREHRPLSSSLSHRSQMKRWAL